MMEMMIRVSFFTFVSFIMYSCNGTKQDENNNSVQITDNGNEHLELSHPVDNDTIPSETANLSADSSPHDQEYIHFKASKLDTVRIGPNQEYTAPDIFFREDQFNVFVLIEEGEYYSEGSVNVDGENIIIKGEGMVSIYCSTSNENVMWVSGNNIVVDNLHMMHKNPGDGIYQNCTGRVIAFDMADSISVLNCDLNGCGLAGLHDNLGNGTVFVENNYIHNNSLGAYTDISGGVWQEEVSDHPVFQFKNNKIEDNGPDEGEQYDEEY